MTPSALLLSCPSYNDEIDFTPIHIQLEHTIAIGLGWRRRAYSSERVR